MVFLYIYKNTCKNTKGGILVENNLSKILGERLLKVSDINAGTGLSKTTLTNIYYQRASNIQIETLVKICDFLQIPMNELIDYQPKEVK